MGMVCPSSPAAASGSPAWPCSGTEPILLSTRGADTAPHCPPASPAGSILPEDVFKSIPLCRLSSQLCFPTSLCKGSR